MLLLMMTEGMSSEARPFRDSVRHKAVIVGQIVLLRVIGVAVTRGVGLAAAWSQGFSGCDNLLGQNPHPRATLSL